MRACRDDSQATDCIRGFACCARRTSPRYAGARAVRRGEDDRFRIRPGAPRSRAGPSAKRFVSRVLRATKRVGPNMQGGSRSSQARLAGFGRGHVVARVAARGMTPRTRRVVVQARLVNLRRAGPRSTARQLRYIERGGVGPNGEPGRAYDATSDEADLGAFTAMSHEDRHQFRFIVSAEDAAQLQDLKSFTRTLMQQMERDLGTPLMWVAVDHWDTDNPHSHIVLRGKDESGRDLVIARDYIAYGLRARACEIATDWLGPRTDREISAALDREVGAERWTSLDQTLQRHADAEGSVRLNNVPLTERLRLVGRSQRLVSMGLAQETAPGQWSLHPLHEPTLRAMGERGDIIRTMQRAMGGATRDCSIHDVAPSSAPIIGRIASHGLIDELHDRAFVVIDGLDGRAHYLPLPSHIKRADLPMNAIIEVRAVQSRSSDVNIAAHAHDGLYRPSDHLRQLHDQTDADEIVTRHVRRLEALRRAGVVERLSDDVWRVPSDFIQRARQYDARHDGGITLIVRSELSVGEQQRAMGATWLDHQLVKPQATLARIGFGAEVHQALEKRAKFLIEQGLAHRRGMQCVFARDLLKTLQSKELDRVSDQLVREFHRPVRRPGEGERVAGVYRRSLLLASGRFALMDEGSSIALVPWRSVMEGRLGRSMSGIVRRGVVSWDFNRSPAQGL